MNHLNLNSATFNASEIKVLLGGFILFSGLILIIYIGKTRFDQYLQDFSPAYAHFYKLIMAELDAHEISEETQKIIAHDLISFIKTRSENEADYAYSKFFRRDDYDSTEDPSFQILSHQIISEYKRKEKLIGFLKFISLVAFCPVIFASILNRFNFGPSLFEVTANLKGFIYILFVVLVLLPLEKWTSFKDRKEFAFFLNIIFVIAFSKISSSSFSNLFLEGLMNNQIKLIPNLYFLIGYLSVSLLSYATQYAIRRNIIRSLLGDGYLEVTI
ncbi:hypothetical protein [Fusibacter sp. 3D3]|uniref:hypothetical protein n=1 Tax=Fusibacter sp. 3D3 TaxID=1048380 RepID=UPI0015860100|nr:hypothetical protein [Fusibacter sp. 3D3]